MSSREMGDSAASHRKTGKALSPPASAKLCTHRASEKRWGGGVPLGGRGRAGLSPFCPRGAPALPLPSPGLTDPVPAHSGSAWGQTLPGPRPTGSPRTTPADGRHLSSFRNKPARTAVRHSPRWLPPPGQGCVRAAAALPGVPTATPQSASLEARAGLRKLSQPGEWEPHVPQPPKLGPPSPAARRLLTQSHCIMLRRAPR